MGRKLKWVKQLLVVFFFAGMILSFCSDNQTITVKADTASQIPTDLTAYYSGENVIVGEEYDRNKLSVTATYSDGTTEIVENYTTTSKKVTKSGENLFTVFYKGKVTQFSVIGKKVSQVSAMYGGEAVSVGNSIDPRQLTVTVIFDDGTTTTITEGYNLVSGQARVVGSNKARVVYQNLYGEFEFIGVAAGTVQEMFVSYVGPAEKGVGNLFLPTDLLVTAVYTDGRSETINNYTLTPDKVQNIGVNRINVYYRGKAASFEVIGKERQAVSISATYKGDTIAVGNAVRKVDIVVTATFDDNTTEKIEDFTIVGGGNINYIGQNLITVDYKGQKAEFYVNGVAEKKPDYINGAKFEVENGKEKGEVSIALLSGITKEMFSVESLEISYVKRLLNRAIRKGDYIPFKIVFKDDNLVDDRPFAMQITIPSSYNVKGCTLYYTPNGKTIIGALTTEVSGTNTIDAQLHNEGIYILAYNFDWEKDAEEDKKLEEENKKKLEEKK